MIRPYPWVSIWGKQQPSQRDRRDEVDTDDGLDLVELDGVKAPLQLECGVVDEDVDTWELSGGGGRDLCRRSILGEIGCHVFDFDLVAPKLLGKRWRFGLPCSRPAVGSSAGLADQ